VRARRLLLASLVALVAVAAALAYRYVPPPGDELAGMEKTATAIESAFLPGWPDRYVGKPLPMSVRTAIDAQYRNILARLATTEFAHRHEGSDSHARIMVYAQREGGRNDYVVRHWFVPESVRFVRRLWNGDIEIEVVGREHDAEASWSPARQRSVSVTERQAFYRDLIRWRMRYEDGLWKVVAKERIDAIDDAGRIVHG
jgi:hypothetical protein